MITKQHLESLTTRAISLDIATRCGIETLAEGTIKDLLGVNHNLGGDGFSIPYIYNGAIQVGDDGVPYLRYRIVDVRQEKDKPDFKVAKYVQRAGAGFMPFVPPIFEAKNYLVITEGELKAISACAHGIPTIAIPGVDMWYCNKSRSQEDALTSDSKVHPVILDYVKDVEAVVVLADSDATTNNNVRKAMSRFCEALIKQTGKAVIYRNVPSNVADDKAGLDDWIAADVEDARAFIIRSVKEAAAQHNVLLNDGYVPLGYQSLDQVVWSRVRKEVLVLPSSSLSNAQNLQSIAGSEWCKIKYGIPTKEDKLRIDWNAMASDIIDECNNIGYYNPLNTRGAGIWRDHDGKAIVNSNTLWRPDGAKCDRVSRGIVYESSIDLGITMDDKPATKEEMLQIFECFKTWHWKYKSDAVLLLGWIAHGYLCGALDWRTHANITGGRGTGKSSLMTLISNLFGDYAVLTDGDSTEAGIRQRIGNASRPILIDEAEAVGTKIGKTLQMLRSASSGAEVLRGTQDGSGTRYQIRACGLVGGIVPPTLNSADASRFLILELVKALSGEEPEFVKNHKLAKEFGRKFFMRILLNCERFSRTLEIVKQAINRKMESNRISDTYGNAVAGAWIALMDDEITYEKAVVFFDKFQLNGVEEQKETSDAQECLTHLLTSMVRTSSGEHTIASLISNVAKLGKASDSYQVLANYGIKYTGDLTIGRIAVNATNQMFKKLFQGTRWEQGNINTELGRIEGAKKIEKTVRINSLPCRAIEVPIEIDLGDVSYPDAV